jgi:hypothetical protein
MIFKGLVVLGLNEWKHIILDMHMEIEHFSK